MSILKAPEGGPLGGHNSEERVPKEGCSALAHPGLGQGGN